MTDGRSVTQTNTYDDWLRVASVTTSGNEDEEEMTVSWSYDARGILTNLVQSFANTNTGPNDRRTAGLRRLRRGDWEWLALDGATPGARHQSWDSAGRRNGLRPAPGTFPSPTAPTA